MIKEVDKFLQDNFEISLDTYFRLTDNKLKKMLKAEIKNFLEEQQEDKQLENQLEKLLELANLELAKDLGLEKEEGEEMLIDSELFIRLFSLFEKMSKSEKDATISTLISFYVAEVNNILD